MKVRNTKNGKTFTIREADRNFLLSLGCFEVIEEFSDIEKSEEKKEDTGVEKKVILKESKNPAVSNSETTSSKKSEKSKKEKKTKKKDVQVSKKK